MGVGLGSAPEHRKRFDPFLFLIAVLAVGAAAAHYVMVDNRFADFQWDWHRNIIDGTGPYPDQYRILTYYLAEGLRRLGMSFQAAHWTLRLVFTFTGALLFYRYLRGWFDDRGARLGTLFFLIVLPVTYYGYGMQPTDPLNFIIFVLGFQSIRDRKDAWLVPLLLVGMLNRETPILLVLAYWLDRVRFAGGEGNSGASRSTAMQATLKAAALGAVALAVYFGLRLVFGPRKPYSNNSPLYLVPLNFSEPRTYINLLLFYNVLWLSAWRNLRERPPFLVRQLGTVLAVFVIHWLIGIVAEVRLFLPTLPILVPLGLMTLAPGTVLPKADRRLL